MAILVTVERLRRPGELEDRPVRELHLPGMPMVGQFIRLSTLDVCVIEAVLIEPVSPRLPAGRVIVQCR